MEKFTKLTNAQQTYLLEKLQIAQQEARNKLYKRAFPTQGARKSRGTVKDFFAQKNLPPSVPTSVIRKAFRKVFKGDVNYGTAITLHQLFGARAERFSKASNDRFQAAQKIQREGEKKISDAYIQIKDKIILSESISANELKSLFAPLNKF